MDQKQKPNQKQQPKEQYNFDYFDKMNQQAAQRKTREATQPRPSNEGKQKQRPPKAKQKKQSKAQQSPRQPMATGSQKRTAPPKGQTMQAQTTQRGGPGVKAPPGVPAPAPQKQGGKVQNKAAVPPPAKKAPKRETPKKEAPRKKVKKPSGQKLDPLPKKPKRQFESPEERQRYFRRMKVLAAMGSVFAAVIAAMVLSMTVFFNIESIEVTGASRYSAQQIAEASGIKNGQNLFTLNAAGVVDNIEKTLPYVNRISVSRHLPSKIVIEVADITVVGAAKTSAGYVVIGTDGKMLELMQKRPDNCPILKGAKLTKTEVGQTIEFEHESQKNALEAFAKALEDGDIANLTQIDISDEYNAKAMYDDRIQLEFGAPNDMDYKFRFANAVLNSGKISPKQKGTMDLSLAAEENKVYFDPDYTVGEPDKEDTSSDVQAITGIPGDDSSSEEAASSDDAAQNSDATAEDTTGDGTDEPDTGDSPGTPDDSTVQYGDAVF